MLSENKTGENNRELRWNILKRLQRLPYNQIGLIRKAVMQKTNCTQSKYYRVIQEKDNDVYVLIALADVLNCKIDDIINSNYAFKNPQSVPDLPVLQGNNNESKISLASRINKHSQS